MPDRPTPHKGAKEALRPPSIRRTLRPTTALGGKAIFQRQEQSGWIQMRTFRAYMLNPAGKIVWADWIEAADLSEAEAKAHALCRDGAPTVELWEGSRRVSDIPCDEAQPTVRTPAGRAG